MAQDYTKSYHDKHGVEHYERNQDIWNTSTYSGCKLEPYTKIYTHDDKERGDAGKDRGILIRKEGTPDQRNMAVTLEFANDYCTFSESNSGSFCICLLAQLYCVLGPRKHHNSFISN